MGMAMMYTLYILVLVPGGELSGNGEYSATMMLRCLPCDVEKGRN
jgi:hypothetical protein